ncbi:hypothetical protein HY490_02185 [Candidatus Woesearchaeota archaeon]|nr:hypothetical protein [Candidatus Woesearchaeota archaeon]
MKKTIVSVMAVLLLALPLALAHAHEMSAEQDSAEPAETTKDTEKTTKEAKPLTKAQEEREKLKERKQNLVAQAKAAREGLKESVKAFRESHKEFADAKFNVHEKRTAAQQCKDKVKPECVQARKDVKLATKDLLKQSSTEALTVLNSVKEKVSASNMPDDKKAETLAKIDARIAAITAAQQNADGLSEESKPADFKDAAKAVRNAWKDTKHDLKKAVVHANQARLGNIAERLQQAQDKLTKAVEKLSGEGKDVGAVQQNLDAVKAKLDEVKKLNDELTAIVASDLATQDKMKQATDKMRDANAALKDAHKLIKDVIAGLREHKA